MIESFISSFSQKWVPFFILGLILGLIRLFYLKERTKNQKMKAALLPYVQKIKKKYEGSVDLQMEKLGELYQKNGYYAIKEMILQRLMIILNGLFFGYVIFFYGKLKEISSEGVSFLWISNIFEKESNLRTIIAILFIETLLLFLEMGKKKEKVSVKGFLQKTVFKFILPLGLTAGIQAGLIKAFSSVVFFFYLGKSLVALFYKINLQLKEKPSPIVVVWEEDLSDIVIEKKEIKNTKEGLKEFLKEIDNIPIFDFIPTYGLEKKESPSLKKEN